MVEIRHGTVEREFRELPCSLTESELVREGLELALLMFQLDEAFALEQHRRQQYNALVEAGQAKVRAHAEVLTGGVIRRPVECQVEWDHDTAEVIVTRLDTGAVIEHRPMTEEERGEPEESDDTPPVTVQ
jgi:hypothetical protein